MAAPPVLLKSVARAALPKESPVPAKKLRRPALQFKFVMIVVVICSSPVYVSRVQLYFACKLLYFVCKLLRVKQPSLVTKTNASI